ncbi:MAG: hypothetical protein ACRC2M_03155 [Planktothrix sp.]
MTSASIAKLRLLKDSIEQKKLAELKQDAAELELSSADVKTFGTLTLKQTWVDAIGNKIAQIFEAVGESAIVSHGDGGDHTEGVEPGGLTLNTITQVEETMIKESHLSAFVPTPSSTPMPPSFPDPQDDDDDEDDDEETDGSTIFDHIVSALPQFNYYQLIALHYGVLLAYQDVQPVAYALDHFGYSDRFSPEQSLSLKLPEFIPNLYESNELIQVVKDLKETQNFKKPENCCPACDGLGNFFMGIAEHLIDWDSCETCNCKGFLEPVPAPVLELPNIEEIPFGDDDDCDGINWQDCPDCEKYLDTICPTCNGLESINPNYKAELLSGGKSNYLINLETYQELGELSPNHSCESCLGSGLVPDFNGDGDEICECCNGTGYAPIITEPTTEPTVEPELSFSRIILEGLGVDLAKLEVKNEPPNPKDFTNFEDFQNALGEYNKRLWESDDDIAQAESELVNAEDIWEQSQGEILNVSGEPKLNQPDDDFQASEFEKETVIAFFREKGSKPEELEEVRQEPLSKLEASFILGYAEHYKKSAEITLRLYLVDWVNDIAANGISPNWKSVAEVKEKLAYQFQLRPDEINCFITPDGWRVSVPLWIKEEILTQEQSKLLSPDDPAIRMMGNGYLFALEQFKKQVSVSQVDLSPVALTHESSLA